MSEQKARFSECLLRHQTRLFEYLYSIVRHMDDADDLFQRASLALCKFDQHDPARPFMAWAFGRLDTMSPTSCGPGVRDRLYFINELNLMPIEAHQAFP